MNSIAEDGRINYPLRGQHKARKEWFNDLLG